MGERVGAYIYKLRQKKEASVREVGDRVGLSPSHLSLIERGQREVSINTLYPLMQVLDGDFNCALYLLALDAGIPKEVLSQNSTDQGEPVNNNAVPFIPNLVEAGRYNP